MKFKAYMRSTWSSQVPGTTLQVLTSNSTSGTVTTFSLLSMKARTPKRRLHTFRCPTGWWHINRTGGSWTARLFRDMPADPNPFPRFRIWRWWR